MINLLFNRYRLTGLVLACLLLATLTACGFRTSAHNTQMPPSQQQETAATLLNMVQTYRTMPDKQQARFLQAVAEQYEKLASADNTLRLALLLSVPQHPDSDLERAHRLLEQLLNVPWTLRADALDLAQLRYRQVQHLLNCKDQFNTLQAKNKKINALEQQIATLQKKIDALTNIEQTVDSPPQNTHKQNP